MKNSNEDEPRLPPPPAEWDRLKAERDAEKSRADRAEVACAALKQALDRVWVECGAASDKCVFCLEVRSGGDIGQHLARCPVGGEIAQTAIVSDIGEGWESSEVVDNLKKSVNMLLRERDTEKARADRAEAACAAMRAALEWYANEDHYTAYRGAYGQAIHAEAEMDRGQRARVRLHSPDAGRGWLSPAEAEALRRDLDEARSSSTTDAVDIVFDGPPGHESGRFVEVERNGKSINAGQWLQRNNGYWVLRINTNVSVVYVRLLEAVAEAVRYFFRPGPGVAVPARHEPDFGEPCNITWNKKIDALAEALAALDRASK